jgi:hypothetical protein
MNDDRRWRMTVDDAAGGLALATVRRDGEMGDLSFNTAAGPLLTLRGDGRVWVSPDVQPDEAARAFLEELRSALPAWVAQVGERHTRPLLERIGRMQITADDWAATLVRQHDELVELRAQLRQLREQEPLHFANRGGDVAP